MRHSKEGQRKHLYGSVEDGSQYNNSQEFFEIKFQEVLEKLKAEKKAREKAEFHLKGTKESLEEHKIEVKELKEALDEILEEREKHLTELEDLRKQSAVVQPYAEDIENENADLF